MTEQSRKEELAASLPEEWRAALAPRGGKNLTSEKEMGMRQKLIVLLKELERALPPPPKCHHSMMYAQYGSDADGWEDRLLLQVNYNGMFHPFFLDEEDFEKSASELVGELVNFLRQPPPSSGPNPL
jgi:hypothetical protein